MNDHLPNVQPELIDLPSLERLAPKDPSTHKPRILLLYDRPANAHSAA